jgi:deoxyadenosine/deoxycytidine kinase
VAVEGLPGAGVGLVAERLAGETGARLVRDPSGENPFLGHFAQEPRRYAFQAQLFFLLARYRQQTTELVQEDLFARGTVADYCFARDRLWAQLTLSVEELGLYEKVHGLLGPKVPRADLVVYLTARPEVLRARLRRRVKSTDRVVENGFVDEIAQAMSSYFFRYVDGPLLVVNTSEIDVESEGFLAELCAVIRKTRAGINHYNPSP